MSLRTRIAAIAGLAVAVTVIAAAVVVYVSVRSNLRGEVKRTLVERVQGYAAAATRFGGPGPGVGPGDGGPGLGMRVPPPRGERFGGATGYVQLVTPDGSIAGPPDQSASLPLTAEARTIAARGSGQAYQDVHAAGTHVMVLSAGLPGGGAIQAARPLTEVDRVLGRVLTLLIVVGLAGIALAALLGGIVARTALAPIATFTRRTESIAAQPDISQRIKATGRDELARLAQSFNTTLDSLERAVESQRQLVADASHELRTPIASLRANIQTLEHADRLPPDELAALRDDVVGELDELTALVASVVDLARGAAPDAVLDDVRLDEVVQSLVERAERREPTLRYRVDLEPTVVRGEPERISRAVSNLLDNAQKWSPAGDEVEVRLADGTLTVRDHGPGFAEEDLPHAFERFYRARAARGMPGSGLGLAIVRQAAEAHGGRVEAANAPGGGAVLRVRFGDAVAMPEPEATTVETPPARAGGT